MHVTIEKDCWDYILDISGSILIPLAIFFIGNIWMKAENERKTNIDKLNYLTLYSHKLMHECGRLKVAEKQRKTALENFIKDPTPANYSTASFLFNSLDIVLGFLFKAEAIFLIEKPSE